jgi:hypothetical protein
VAGVFTVNDRTYVGSSRPPSPGSYVIKTNGYKGAVVNNIR